MKKAPSIYNLRESNYKDLFVDQPLIEIDGKWYPARPLGLYSISWRFRAAWLAFTGRVDLLHWPGGQ